MTNVFFTADTHFRHFSYGLLFILENKQVDAKKEIFM